MNYRVNARLISISCDIVPPAINNKAAKNMAGLLFASTGISCVAIM